MKDQIADILPLLVRREGAGGRARSISCTSRGTPHPNPLPEYKEGERSAFTLIELLVVIGILVILASIFIPYALRLREENRRIDCRDRLQQIFKSMQAYAADNGSSFPRTKYEANEKLTAFGSNADWSNNVTAALWLLVKNGYVRGTSIFLCPSAGGNEAPVDPTRSDFFNTSQLGYSYASPYGQTDAYHLTDTLKPAFALMADQNPGGAMSVPQTAPLLTIATINSRNHGQAGQNVLYAYGSVEWQITPYCGMNNDNIYTVRGSRGSTQPTTIPSKEIGTLDPAILPSADDDSFLYPPRVK